MSGSSRRETSSHTARPAIRNTPRRAPRGFLERLAACCDANHDGEINWADFEIWGTRVVNLVDAADTVVGKADSVIRTVGALDPKIADSDVFKHIRTASTAIKHTTDVASNIADPELLELIEAVAKSVEATEKLKDKTPVDSEEVAAHISETVTKLKELSDYLHERTPRGTTVFKEVSDSITRAQDAVRKIKDELASDRLAAAREGGAATGGGAITTAADVAERAEGTLSAAAAAAPEDVAVGIAGAARPAPTG